jgi:hypothetical protein
MKAPTNGKWPLPVAGADLDGIQQQMEELPLHPDIISVRMGM